MKKMNLDFFVDLLKSKVDLRIDLEFTVFIIKYKKTLSEPNAKALVDILNKKDDYADEVLKDLSKVFSEKFLTKDMINKIIEEERIKLEKHLFKL